MEKITKRRANRRGEFEEKSKLVEQLYVHDVYERIAIDFEDQQHQPWPKVKDFLLNMEPGSLVADIGCGNGHYLNVNPLIMVVGMDRSNSLISAANERAPGVTCRGDCLSLPFRDELFDAVLFIGVIHHLVTTQRQAKSLKELSRIVRPDGRILLCTWAYEQQNRKFVGQNLLVPRQVADGQSDSRPCDCGAATKNEKLTVQRKVTVLRKLEQILLGPNSLIGRLLSREHSLESNGDDKSSTSTTPSTDSADEFEADLFKERLDESIEVPIEFQVREFPASSLFSTSENSTNQNLGESRTHSRICSSHNTSPARSRDDRFYHVFKNGELEKLVRHNTPELEVIKCLYESGHWCATLRKTR